MATKDHLQESFETYSFHHYELNSQPALAKGFVLRIGNEQIIKFLFVFCGRQTTRFERLQAQAIKL